MKTGVYERILCEVVTSLHEYITTMEVVSDSGCLPHLTLYSRGLPSLRSGQF